MVLQLAKMLLHTLFNDAYLDGYIKLFLIIFKLEMKFLFALPQSSTLFIYLLLNKIKYLGPMKCTTNKKCSDPAFKQTQK